MYKFIPEFLNLFMQITKKLFSTPVPITSVMKSVSLEVNSSNQ